MVSRRGNLPPVRNNTPEIANVRSAKVRVYCTNLSRKTVDTLEQSVYTYLASRVHGIELTRETVEAWVAWLPDGCLTACSARIGEK